MYLEIRDTYRGCIPVYTDGSRDWNYVACATVFPSDTVIYMRLPDSTSIYTAEVWAMIKSLEQIKDSVASKYIIFTDSLSCLEALQYLKLEHPLIGMVKRKYVKKYFVNKTLFLVNYQAILVLGAIRKQTAAKSTLDLPRVMISIPYVDFKQYILSTWQDNWVGVVTNKLPLRVWEPKRGAGVIILFENGQSPHNSSYEAPCLP